MGRCVLRKIDPALDLSRHFKTIDELPNPWDAEALFGRRAPLEVEVGSGKGLFLESAARAVPEHNFLGIEIAGKYARFCAARLARHGLDNACAVKGDARQIFVERLPSGSVAAVHVYFPDPWWKKRHHKRRVMTESFLREIERVLIPGGTLHFWTDVHAYFDASVQLIGEHTQLTGPHAVAEKTAEHDLDYRTHFERRKRLEGESIRRAEFHKPAP